MKRRKTYSIAGKRPDGDWGTVDALRSFNAEGDVEDTIRLAKLKLADWNKAASDLQGAFHGWSFELRAT